MAFDPRPFRVLKTAVAAAVAALALSFAAPREACADTIILKNGNKITGVIIHKSDTLIGVRVGNTGTVYLRPDEIESVTKDAKTGEVYVEGLRDPTPVEDAADATPEGGSAEAKKPDGEAVKPDGEAKAPPAKKKTLVDPIALTPEEERKIAESIFLMSQAGTGSGGSGAQKREVGRKGLVDMKRKSIPALVEALGKTDNWYRRWNAAFAVQGIAESGEEYIYLSLAVPALLAAIEDPNKWPRVYANAALEAATKKSMKYLEPSTNAMTQYERDAIDKWQEWWKEEKARLDAEYEWKQ